MYGEYINIGLMLLIIGATFWILRSPKKKSPPSGECHDTHPDEEEKRP